MKNNLKNNHFLNKETLNQYKEEYLYLLNDILLPFWNTYPAWHWAKQFSNMNARLIAKINKEDADLLKYHYYTAFIDEDGLYFYSEKEGELNEVFSINGVASVSLNYSETKLLHLAYIDENEDNTELDELL